MAIKILSVKDIEDILNVRLMIESYSAKIAAKNIQKHPEDIQRLNELLGFLEQ